MKKNFVLLFCLLLTLGASAQRMKDFSHWSLTIEGGINRFDGDIQPDYGKKVLPAFDPKMTLGGSLEYTLAPAWSLGVDYYYLDLGVDKRPNGGRYFFDTQMHNVSLFTSFNAIKAFFPTTNTKWGLWGGIGFGYSIHNVNYQTDADGVMIDTKWGKFQDADYTNPNGRAIFIPVHLLAEYNFTRNFALGLKAQYRGYMVDDLDGIFRPNSNDALEFATLQLRWKFCARKKDHTRNINLVQFAGLNNNDGAIDDLQRQINNIVIPLDPTDRLDDLERRLKKLEDYLDIDGPDDDNDGVANSRDQEPNTPAGNQVDFWGRTIPKGAVISEEAFVYFDFDKTELDEEGYKAVRIAAEKLMADPELILEVRGYTDNMGGTPYNAALSQRRADRVKSELVKMYGIEANRVIANGKGKFNPQDSVVPYRPYRTCILFYSK